MSSDLVKSVNDDTFRSALETINVNATNFQVFTLGIAVLLFAGIAIVLADCVVFAAQNQSLDSNTFMALVFVNIAFVIAIVLAYMFYLRNIGRYIYSRIKPSKLPL